MSFDISDLELQRLRSMEYDEGEILGILYAMMQTIYLETPILRERAIPNLHMMIPRILGLTGKEHEDCATLITEVQIRLKDGKA